MNYFLFILTFSGFQIVDSDVFGKIRKISSDAAPEKAQEVLTVITNNLKTLKSAKNGPTPAPFTIGPPAAPISTSPHPPSVRPIEPPSAIASPPSVKPLEELENTVTTESLTSTTNLKMSTVDVTTTESMTSELSDENEEDQSDSEEQIDSEGPQKEDVAKNEELGENSDDVKEIIRKVEINQTDDYYVTSPATTVSYNITNSTIEDESIDFNELFEKKDGEESEMETSIKMIPTTQSPISSTSLRHIHTKTCIDLEDLKKVDDDVNRNKFKKKVGSIEVSVELEEDISENNSENASEEEKKEENERSRRRKVRHDQMRRKQKWRKYEMDCDKEEDEKGKFCKIWASGGLCLSHKPTMFLFCRKTCLCIGPQ